LQSFGCGKKVEYSPSGKGHIGTSPAGHPAGTTADVTVVARMGNSTIKSRKLRRLISEEVNIKHLHELSTN
jgi:hypothetical protein